MTTRWWALHPRSWVDIGKDLGHEMRRDNVPLVAAGVAFYAVLAMLPALIIAVSIYGLFTNTAEAERQIESLLEVLPESTVRVIEAQMQPIADLSHTGLGIGVIVSLVALLWTVSNAIRALVRAVVIAYDQDGQRSPLERRYAALGITIVAISGGLVVLALIAAVPVWLNRFDPTNAIVTFGNLRWLFIGAVMVGGTAFLYRYSPPRRPASWGAVMPGVLVATLLWTIVSLGFSVYVSSFATYNQTYGTLGAAIVLLLWFWFTALAVILGAEINEVLATRAHREASQPDVPGPPATV